MVRINGEVEIRVKAGWVAFTVPYMFFLYCCILYLFIHKYDKEFRL